MERKRCLLLLPRFPFPPVGGDKLRYYYLLQMLSNHYELEVIVITDEKSDADSVAYIKRYATEYKIFSYPKWRCKLNVLRAVSSPLPLQVLYYHFSTPQRYIKERVKECDFAFACLIRTTWYLAKSNGTKFHDMTDSLALNYKNSVEKVDSFFWRMIYHVEMNRLFKYEKRMMTAFDNTFLVNKKEWEFWKGQGNITWIPNGVNKTLVDRFQDDEFKAEYQKSLVFFGKMNYQPNKDAVIWFIRNVFPYLSKGLRFVILGAKPTPDIKRLAGQFENVEVTGYVEDPYAILKSCLVVVAPMQTGAGIQNKILESMALGKIVVTTSLSAAPISGASNMEHLIIADSGRDMVEIINKISLNPLKYKHIGINAHEFIKSNYTWELYEAKLVRTISETISA